MIEEYLKEHGAIGSDNAIPAGTIAKDLGVQREAVIKQVGIERRKGSLICACNTGYGGYFWPGDITDIITQRDRLEHEVNSRLETLEPFQCAVHAFMLANNEEKGGVDFEELSD